MKAVVLAAGMGSRLAPLTNDRPKPLVEVGGQPLLFRTLDRLDAVGVRGGDVIVVAGYREDVLRATLARYGRKPTVVTNEKYDVWGSFWSLFVARDALHGADFLQLEGDVLFDRAVLPLMIAAPGPAALAVVFRDQFDDEMMKVEVAGPGAGIRAMSKQLDRSVAAGEYMGATRIDARLNRQVFDELEQMAADGQTHEHYDHAYHRLAQRGAGPFTAVDIGDCMTIEVDNLHDLRRAEGMLRDRVVA